MQNSIELDGIPAWPTLGVLGGMGPLAGATFASRLVQLTPVRSVDQAHIPVLLHNDPRIPDRASAKLSAGADPYPAMLQGLQRLCSWGADCLVMPCNTAHIWYDELQANVNRPILHIIDSVVQDLKNQGITQGKIGVMGTLATLKLELYQQALSKAGYTPIVGTPAMQAMTMQAINLVKANQEEASFEPAAQVVRELEQMGANAVVLGCTELPLAIPPRRRHEFTVPMADSIDALAKAVIHYFIEQMKK